MKDLGAGSTVHGNFWIERMPHLSLQNEGICYALVALGAAHHNFLLQKSQVAWRPQGDMDRFIILHYNLAIRYIQPLMSNPTAANIQISLICCILFICFENVRGQYLESMKHLKSGSRLLASVLSSESGSMPIMPNSRQPCSLNEETEQISACEPEDGMDSIVTLFSCLGLDTSMLVEDEVVSQRQLCGQSSIPAAVETFGPIVPFSSLNAARKELHQIEITHDIFYEIMYPCDIWQTRPEQKGLTCSELPPPNFSEKDLQSYRGIYQQFMRWSARFDLFMGTFLGQSASAKDLCEAFTTRLHQKTWIALLDEEPWSPSQEDDFEEGDLRPIVDEVELIIKSLPPSPRALFSFDAAIIPPLSLVGCFTKDMELLQRVVIALRALDRREGVWDSKDLAEVFEASIIAQKCHGWPINGVSKDVLSIAKSLRSLNISCISPTNSIVELALQIG
ncbi:hypothetical protein JX265_001771 [Neoarthrinium moseri]|uniref:Uncharacterized protein n=1 Tax=Neoarthrinium moseri TaxID=1658444 RepID=A0A9P9WVS8_9PEZI|nr:hypothetical protein JX265_001771 [Neoarthrinium moseri]